ncbi:nucleotidyl transferase AbiEii/AbiGii toxin family protein [Patescibacteria group bacterium]|nr:nucleotidyl transferase AbiEii/AbiGii toxin family protein [Patescibacteria group bacterium]MBU4057152.1 nucleotidyl transferase AbiEii/AbiGii toxin family protein [Patescibacteria group bacterium]
MLEQEIVNKLSKELQIAPEFVSREAWEIIILKELFEKKWSKNLVFKGGTALRLAYGSPRFSVDLDFSVLGKINPKDFFDFLNDLAKKYPELDIVDKQDKFYTLLAEIRVRETYLPRSFLVKIEISKREKQFKKSEWAPKILKTPAYPVEVIANVTTLEKIYSDKIEAIKTREAPRDMFDVWYLSEILKKPYEIPKTKLSKKEIKSDLNKFVPKNYQKAVEFIIKNIKN